jgi:hypothetical protein
MSATRLADDVGAYRKVLRESADQLSYVLDPNRFVHADGCRVDLGVVGGNAASTLVGEALVDTDSELKNITRRATRADTRRRDFSAVERNHLKSCQMVTYKKVPGAVWVPPSLDAARY